MRIGILQTGHAPDEIRGDEGDYADMFVRLLDGHDFDFETFDVVDMVFPDGPEAADAWLITGSKFGVYEDHPWLPPLEDLIREIVAAGRPLVGICFGHQVIAQALGGQVEKFDGGWAVGRQNYEIGGETVALNAWHKDQVIRPPDGAKVIASNDFCRYAGFAIGDNVLTIQPHPEFSAAVIVALIQYRGGALPPEQVSAARDTLDDPTDSAVIARMMADTLAKGAR